MGGGGCLTTIHTPHDDKKSHQFEHVKNLVTKIYGHIFFFNALMQNLIYAHFCCILFMEDHETFLCVDTKISKLPLGKGYFL